MLHDVLERLPVGERLVHGHSKSELVGMDDGEDGGHQRVRLRHVVQELDAGCLFCCG